MCQEYDKAVNYTMQTVKALFFKVNNYSQNYDFRNSYSLNTEAGFSTLLL